MKLVFSTLTTCLLFVITIAKAQQTYPIYVTPLLTPPYSLTLSDYSKIGSQRLVVTIMVRDVTITNLPVRLSIRMETTNGVTIETIPTAPVIPIFLTGGEGLVLFGDDLKDYFNINNLQFKGYSKEEYRRTGQLPEGFYRVTVEVHHFATGRLISNQGMAMAWIALGKPPVLKIPDNKSELGQINGMPLTFSWLPSTVGTPNNGIQYTFEMWEVRIPGIDPNVIAASMPVFYSTTQMNTSLVIQPAMLMLEPGMNYAWRVTASDVMGQVPFAQGGRSEVRTFMYQCHCDSVTNFNVDRQGQDVTFRWTPANSHTSFNVELNNPESGWSKSERAYDAKLHFISDPEKTYRARVQAICQGNEMNPSDFTSWQTVTVPGQAPVPNGCECGKEFPDRTLTNFTLRTDLQPGDTIENSSGDTRYIIKTVNKQSENTYKGLFWFCWEYYRVKILCEYWDLQVNTDNRILKYNFESVYNPQFLLDVDAAKAYMDSLANAIAGLIPKPKPEIIELDFTIPENPEYHYDDESGILTVIDENGNPHGIELPKNKDGETKFPVTITDNQGNSYEVKKDKDGYVRLEKIDNQDQKQEETTKEYAVFYNNIDFNPVDTLFIIKGFNRNADLLFKKQINKQWNIVNALWNVNDNAGNTASESFSIKNFETTDFYIIAKQDSVAKDSVVLYVNYLEIDAEQEIIKALLEIKNLEAHFDNLVDSLDKALECEQWDKPLIKGIDNKYVKRGMNKYFKELTEPYEPCGFPIFDIFYQIYATDLLISKYDGKFDELIKKINSIMQQNGDGTYKINANFIQSVMTQIELMHCTTKADAEMRYKIMINDITFQNILTNE